jgi:hypothetical protein
MPVKSQTYLELVYQPQNKKSWQVSTSRVLFGFVNHQEPVPMNHFFFNTIFAWLNL